MPLVFFHLTCSFSLESSHYPKITVLIFLPLALCHPTPQILLLDSPFKVTGNHLPQTPLGVYYLLINSKSAPPYPDLSVFNTDTTCQNRQFDSLLQTKFFFIFPYLKLCLKLTCRKRWRVCHLNAHECQPCTKAP